MKNLLTATLPALGLLALGGCATSGALTSTTESDGVYYSSADKTTANRSLGSVYDNRTPATGAANAYGTQAPASAPAATTSDDANPDYYQGSTTAVNSGIQGANSDYYASNYGSYNPSGFGVPYTGPGVSSYNYAPVTTVAYGSPWSYGAGFGYGYPYYGGGFYSPYAYSAFYDPFYSPFYSPWYGPGLSLSFGYGGWGGYPYGGWGGWGGYPYGYGYGRGYYGDPYGYGGYGYYGRPIIYANGSRAGSGSNPILVGPRGSRGGAVLNGGRAAGSSNPVEIGRRNGGTFTGGGLAPTTGQPTGTPVAQQLDGFGRERTATPTSASAPGNQGGQQLSGFGRERMDTRANGLTNAGQPASQQIQPAAGGRREREGGFFSGFFGNGAGRTDAGNGRSMSDAPGGQPAEMGGRRTRDLNNGRSMSEMGGQPGMSRREFSQPQFDNRGGNGGYQPQPRREFGGGQMSQPRMSEQRGFSQPTFSQPQPSRSFDGGGRSGGGSFNGGGGGGGGFGGGRRGGR